MKSLYDKKKKQNKFDVLVSARELLKYVIEVTHKSPKEYRFLLVSNLHKNFIEVLENIRVLLQN
jgi:hypothetical protein